MIAPLHTKKKTPASRRLRAARAMIAAMLLPSEAPAPPIAAWKAWLFVVWIGMTVLVYALSMAGLTLQRAG